MAKKEAAITAESISKIASNITNLLQANTKIGKTNAHNMDSAKIFRAFGGVLVLFLALIWCRAFFWDYQVLVQLGLVATSGHVRPHRLLDIDHSNSLV